MIRHMPFRVAVTAGLALVCAASVASCRRGGAKTSPVLSSAMASGAKLNAGGEQPLWALQIRQKTVTFSSEKIASITLTNVDPRNAPHGDVWAGDAGGRPFRAIITAAPCKDAATGLTYPLSAQVEAIGVTYNGCATKAGQGLGPRD